MNASTYDFEALFNTSTDPWHFRTRWYEQRKRALILASLPRQHYRRIFEPACANGELSAALAPRCDALLCQDVAPTAVRLARERLAGVAHAEVMEGRLPDDWPEGRFDLVVLGEIGYYLSRADWQETIVQAADSLAPGGGVMACHWLPAIQGCALDGEAVHALIARHLPLQRLFEHREGNFLLEYWCDDGIPLDEVSHDRRHRSRP